MKAGSQCPTLLPSPARHCCFSRTSLQISLLCAWKDERVLITVRAKHSVPPGEVEGSVVARVHMVQVVCLGGGSQGCQANTGRDKGMQPQRCLIAGVSKDVGPHLPIQQLMLAAA